MTGARTLWRKYLDESTATELADYLDTLAEWCATTEYGEDPPLPGDGRRYPDAAPVLRGHADAVRALHALATKAVDALDEVTRELACERGDETAAPEGWEIKPGGAWGHRDAKAHEHPIVERVSDGWQLWLGGERSQRHPTALAAMLAADKVTP